MARAKATEQTPAETPATDDRLLVTSESERVAGRKSGRAQGDLADKTYYLTSDGKVTSTQPEEAIVLVAEGDVVTALAAEQIKGK